MKDTDLKDPPIIKLVTCMLVDAYDLGKSELSFSLESPPEFSVDGKEFIPESDLIKKMINRLKIMSKLNPMKYHETAEGNIKLMIRGNPVGIRTKFLDSKEKQSCWIEIEN